MEIKNRELHRVTSTAIIHKDGRYLIVKRALNKKAFPEEIEMVDKILKGANQYELEYKYRLGN